MMQEEKKESFFKKLFWISSDNKEKISKIDKKIIIDFDTWLNMVDSLIKEKNWKKALNYINKVRQTEKKNTSILLRITNEEKKEAVKKTHLSKLNELTNYEKNIEELINKEKEEKKSKFMDDKIIYAKNRLDYYIKSENYKKANETLTSFYEKYKDSKKVSDFYNKEKQIFQTVLVPKNVSLVTKKSFFWNLFWKPLENTKSWEKINKEEVNKTTKETILDKEGTTKNNDIFDKKTETTIDKQDIKTEVVKKEIEKEKVVLPVSSIDNTKKEEKIEPKQEKQGLLWRLFGWKKEIATEDVKDERKVEPQKISNFDSAIKLLESLINSKNYDKAKWGLNEIRKKEEKAFNSLSEIDKKKQESTYKIRINKLDELVNKIENETIKVKNIDEIKTTESNFESTKEKEIIDDETTLKNNKNVSEIVAGPILEAIKEGENEKVIDGLLNNVKKEEKVLWISELSKTPLIEELSTEKIDKNNLTLDNKTEKVEEKKLWIEKTSVIKSNDLVEVSDQSKDKLIQNESNADELIIKTENKEEVKGFFNKFFNKDTKNLDKVANLMESLMNIKDLDKAISAVEAVKNIDWKNVVIKEQDSSDINQVEKNKEVANSNITDTSINKETKTEVKNSVLKLEEKWAILEEKEEKKEENKINVEEIKDFDWAMKWIKYFIHTKDFKKAKSWIEEIKIKEEKAFNELYEKIDIDKEQKKQKDIYHKKLIQIEKLGDFLENEEIAYNEKIEEEKFKLKFIQIKTKLDEIIWMKKYYEAMDLINGFFEENKNSVTVIKFSNKWKNIIQKKIKKQEEDKDKENSKNARKEAELLIWENINFWNETNQNKVVDWKSVKKSFFKEYSEKMNLYNRIKLKLKEKKLVDEVTLLIESQNEVDEMAKKSRLENMHMWLIKELDNDKLLWYELYAKILWKDKISWDTFWFFDDETAYKFFLWDATGHWVQAWLIVTLLTRLFYNFSKWSFLEKLVFEVNNWLKQDLKSWNFITWIFFEVDKTNLDSLKYVWMWHEPMLIFRKNSMEVEKYIAWWLAAWIRIINDINNIKTNNVKLNDGDILFIYSDWIVESRNKANELLWIEWFKEILKKVCMNFTEWKITDLYWSIIEEIKSYKWWSVNFYDDATIFILKRNSSKDIVDKKSMYLKDLSIKEWLSKKNVRELEWKTKEEIEKKLEKIRKEKQLNLIISNLEKLYITWEVLKLKQEAIRYIKEWFIHKKINRYLKKAITNERQYKIDLKDQKMKSRYVVLKELLKKWDYSTVIRESSDIISSDWNITI